MKIAIIGAGNMGGAIARGLVRSKFITPAGLTIADLDNSVRSEFEALGVKTTTSTAEAAENAEVVLIAVKPWLVEEVSDELKSVVFKNEALVGSVAAGVALVTLGRFFEGPLFRIMPNIAATVGESMTFIASQNASEEQTGLMGSIFKPLGAVMDIREEQLDACMALASCGIAYAMRYIRAAVEGGVELGIPPAVGQKIVIQTLVGASALLTTNNSHPEAEIDKVTTPGGVTIKGLNAMEKYGFTNAVVEGLKASVPKKN